MPAIKIMGKLMEGSDELLNKAKIGFKGKDLSSIKKQMNELVEERNKLYNVIGMEAYDLHHNGRLESQELELYFEKVNEITEKINHLEEEKSHLEISSGKGSVCQCGVRLSKTDKFCPGCGKKIESRTVICTCGSEIEGSMSFCPKCGTPVETLMAQGDSQVSSNSERECICGAKVKAGQFMCMECGRKIEA